MHNSQEYIRKVRGWCIWLLYVSITIRWSCSNALHADETNVTDFHIRTCGHGPVKSAIYHSSSSMDNSTPETVVSSGDGKEGQCYICGRSVYDGAVIWRRNVCEATTVSSRVALSSKSSSNKGYYAYSISDGVVKRWNEVGDVTHEAYFADAVDILVDVSVSSREDIVVIAGSDNKLYVVDEYLVQTWYTIDLVDALAKFGKVRFPKLFGGKINVVAVEYGYIVLSVYDVSNTVTTLATMKLKDDGAVDKVTSYKMSNTSTSMDVESVRVTKEGMVIGAVESSGCWIFADAFGSKFHSVSSINPAWSSLESMKALQKGYVQINAVKDSGVPEVGLFQVNSSGALVPITALQHLSNPTAFSTFVYENNEVLIGAVEEENDQYTVFVYHLHDSQLLYKSVVDAKSPLHPSSNGKVTAMTLSCNSFNCCHALLGTSIGTTFQLSTSTSPEPSTISFNWRQEEALGYISNALFMDSHHEPDESSSSLVAPRNTDKLVYFGFQKLLLLLSSTYDTLFAMDTVGHNKGSILYTKPLPPNALKHTLVHGSPTSKSGVHGAFFSTNTQHAQSLLIVSTFQTTVQWRCLHTPSGAFTSMGEAPLEEGQVISSIFPFWDDSNKESCPQRALLLFDDDTVMIIPNNTQDPNADYKSSVFSPSKSKDGMYIHSVNKDTGDIQCQKLHPDNLQLQLTGQTNFNPQQEIVRSVTYPSRNEVVQTPSTILGDDSLLLKYLNPHIMVLVSELTPEYLSLLEQRNHDKDDFFTAMMNNAMGASSTSTNHKKPLGVTPANTTASSTQSLHTSNIPTLFITLLDTTSCRILHRVSHSHTTSNNKTPQATNTIPLIISENWIVYSYFNHKSKRTDLSVLSLYEGMIDKHGITAFVTPDQELEFDSILFPKPIVLQKTYAVPKRISSIGVTTTSRGITSKNFIFALGDIGWIWKLDARMLDPRRPTAELKTIEKMEGLLRYSALLPILSSHIISYNLRIEQPTKIISTSARLESQSLVLAFGGPDLFFTRLAPSKSFDLLPDNFNKSLLGMLVVVLLVGLFWVRRMSERKMLKSAWA